jgi:hypothetical protein
VRPTVSPRLEREITMRTRSPVLALAILSALTGFARSAEPSEPTQAELWGPSFIYGWSVDDIDTIKRAFAKLELEHSKDPLGITDYELARAARILQRLQNLTITMHGIDVVLQDARGRPWTIVRTTLPETILTGFAVSRDRYCHPNDQDMDELDAIFYCLELNRRAIQLFKRIESMRHLTPGGANSEVSQ